MRKKGSSIGWACWLMIVACVIAVHVLLKQNPKAISLEFASKIRNAEHYIDMVFVVLYGMVAMYPISVITTFLRDEGMDNARYNLGKMKESAPLPATPNIKGLNASRKLRQAEADFITLKNLYDNGLITEQMFLHRKTELKAGLSSSEIFNRDNDASVK